MEYRLKESLKKVILLQLTQERVTMGCMLIVLEHFQLVKSMKRQSYYWKEQNKV